MGDKSRSVEIVRQEITSVRQIQNNGLFQVDYEFSAKSQVPDSGRHCVIDFYCQNHCWIAGVSAKLGFLDDSLEHKGTLNLAQNPASFNVTWLSWT